MQAEGNAPTVLTYNPLLDGLVAHRMLNDALAVLQQARSPALPPMQTLRIVTVGDFVGEMSPRGRFATPVDFPRHDCSTYSHVHTRRDSL
jgi:pentatricopeptide repeat protein